MRDDECGAQRNANLSFCRPFRRLPDHFEWASGEFEQICP
jgi:hypothetical protein